MRVLVILNGISRKKKLFYRQIHPQLRTAFAAEVWETEYSGHAEELALKGTTEGFEVILSAGGDGTMNQVVNGVIASGKPLPILGLIPLGSGNDLARAFGAVADADRIIDLIKKRQVAAIDVGLAKAYDKNGTPLKRYFINECSMGMGPEVVRRINEGGRNLGAELMYLKSIVTTFLFHSAEAIHVKTAGLTWSGKSRVLAIANGRSFGHGIYIAPDGSVFDGRLNLFIAANPPLFKFLLLLQVLKRPKQANDKCLTYSTVTSIEVKSDRPLPVEADGEMVGVSPLYCEVVPKKLNFLC